MQPDTFRLLYLGDQSRYLLSAQPLSRPCHLDQVRAYFSGQPGGSSHPDSAGNLSRPLRASATHQAATHQAPKTPGANATQPARLGQLIVSHYLINNALCLLVSGSFRKDAQ